MRKRILPVAIAVAAAAVFLGLRAGGRRDTSGALRASGTVEATEAQLGFPATGRLDSVAVREGARVQAGAQLAWLDGAERQARHAQAEAHVRAARALLQELERGARAEELARARAARDAARERRTDAERDRERTQRLFEGGAVSREALDKAQLALDVMRNQATQAEEELRLVAAGPRRERIEAQRAELARAEAALREHAAALSNLVLRAPFAGVVSVRHREPGEIVAAGTPVLTLLDPLDSWVRIYVPENRVGAVRLGQKARITCDTFPDRTYAGEVVFMASEAEFTPKNVQTPAERVKLVYAVKVRLTGDGDLKPGMPADVVLEAEP